ncbi:hypothetical protein [Bacillus cereus]|uniref:Uncharacterized protein n=1 Tax=Bacillus cereus HuA3-9 TaxID=1053205 RepID=R8CIL4_BACCE|nr:hypothetical protein [Bacillus cereus]EOO11432.1 hypothetical protein IGA_05695 [Bacillus cereus HuA3-9]
MTEYRVTYTATKHRTTYEGVKFINTERPTDAITRLISWYPEHDFSEIKAEVFNGVLSLDDIKSSFMFDGALTYHGYTVKPHSRGWVSFYKGEEFLTAKRIEESADYLQSLVGIV